MAEKQPCALCRSNHESDIVHICGDCVQILLDTDQDELKRVYELAKVKNSIDQMWAINCFINKEGIDDSAGKKPDRSESIELISDRTGSSRLTRPVERAVRQIKKKGVSILRDQQHFKAVLGG